MLVVLGLLPVFVLLVAHAMDDWKHEQQEIQIQARRMAELSAGGVAEMVSGIRQTLLVLANTEVVRKMNVTACNVYFAEIQKNTLACDNIGLVLPDGSIAASALPLSGRINIGERPWFQRMQKSRTFSAGEYQIGKVTGKPDINFAMPLPGQSQNDRQAAIYISMSLEKLRQSISEVQLQNDAVIKVVDRNGIELARNPLIQSIIGSKSGSWELSRGKAGKANGFVEAMGKDGVQRIYYYEPVPNSDDGLFVGVGLSKNRVMAVCWKSFSQQMLILGVVTILALVIADIAAELSVIRHTKLLVGASRKLAEGGDVKPLKLENATLELRQLAASYNEMVQALQRHRLHLEELVSQRTTELTATAEKLKAQIVERERVEKDLRQLNAELKDSLDNVRQLSGLLPICAGCKQIRDDKGYWNSVESYIQKHSEATFTHGMCPDCARKYFPDQSS